MALTFLDSFKSLIFFNLCLWALLVVRLRLSILIFSVLFSAVYTQVFYLLIFSVIFGFLFLNIFKLFKLGQNMKENALWFKNVCKLNRRGQSRMPSPRVHNVHRRQRLTSAVFTITFHVLIKFFEIGSSLDPELTSSTTLAGQESLLSASLVLGLPACASMQTFCVGARIGLGSSCLLSKHFTWVSSQPPECPSRCKTFCDLHL